VFILQIICGNIVALIASILMLVSGMVKDRKKIIYIQTLQILAFAISDLILGGYTGTIVNLISLVRNYLCYKDKLTNIKQIILIILSVVFSLLFNNLGFLGLLPLISTVVYTCFMNVKDTIKLKSLIIFTMVLWLIYDTFIKSYTSAIFDFFSIIANIVTIYQLYNNKKQEN
jgi:hypothetical protein